jgi:hypothetical protein
LSTETAEQICYNDIPTFIKGDAAALLQPQPSSVFAAQGTYNAWQDYHTTYIFCDNDSTIPSQSRGIREGTLAPFVRTIPQAHCAHAVVPQWVAAIIREAAGEKLA